MGILNRTVTLEENLIVPCKTICAITILLKVWENSHKDEQQKSIKVKPQTELQLEKRQ